MHDSFVTLFHPGEMPSIYFLDRESDVAAGHEASSINRAVAFYRSLAGIPTGKEPPAAR